ncbi:hypothetical protein ILYODFUR_035159 [Ilyodon furcidens]|uniref:Uncharacterized protein n=1 Tax=Ilyodon furcidens TaxID=33524 RepID=A0ABV0SVB3_9TELE
MVSKMKHPDPIHVWGWFSTKGVGGTQFCPRMLPWMKNGIKMSSKSSVVQQPRDSLVMVCGFSSQMDPDPDMEMLDLWSGGSPDLNPAQDLRSVFKRQMEKQKPTK